MTKVIIGKSVDIRKPEEIEDLRSAFQTQLLSGEFNSYDEKILEIKMNLLYWVLGYDMNSKIKEKELKKILEQNEDEPR